MDFNLSEEQQLLLDTTRRMLAKEFGFAQRQAVLDSAAGVAPALWQQFAEVGLLALNVPESDGGLGGGAVETMLVAMALGEALVVEPFVGSAVVATHCIAAIGSQAQRALYLPQLAAGSLIAVLAHDEAGQESAAAPRQTVAAAEGDGYVLRGVKQAIYHAPVAGLWLVSAQMADGSGLAVFAVPAADAAVQMRVYATVDGQRAADLQLSAVRVPAAARLGGGAAGDVGAALAAVLDLGLAAHCAEAVGALDAVLKQTIDYARTRQQFGQPIGRFQALQHRMADMLIHVEQARSMLYWATSACSGDTAARAQALSAAKVLIGRAARYVGQQAVQLHGGMGMTDELGISHYFKRLLAFELRGGTTEQHLQAYARGLQAASTVPI